MKRLICLATLALVVVAAPAFPQFERRAQVGQDFASDFQTVPVMANTTGVGGAKFQTFVTLLNPTTTAFSIDVTLYDAAGTKRNATITLAAGELKTYSNFLDTVFSYVGGGAVTFRSSSSANRFIVSTEIYTATGNRYGTSIPVLEFAGSNSRSFAAAITVDSSARTNIGCFNQSDAANTVKATVYDATGTQAIGTVTLNLAANAWGQTGVSSIVSGGYVTFEPSEAAVCYAVVVINATNDGRFTSAAEYKP